MDVIHIVSTWIRFQAMF